MLDFNIEGYNLIEGEYCWYLQVVGDTVFTGTFREVYVFAIRRGGFKSVDLDEAILDMVNKNCNAAHFGAFKRYMYAHNVDVASGKKVA